VPCDCSSDLGGVAGEPEEYARAAAGDGAQRTRIEDELRRERQASSAIGGGEGTPRVQGGAAPALTEVLEYRPHEDGYLQCPRPTSYPPVGHPFPLSTALSSSASR
jgi:hypothetical protein